MGIADVVVKMVEVGFFQFFAPFALVFLLTYGVLLKFKPFGEWKGAENRGVSMIYAITAFLMGTFVLLFGLNTYIETFLAWVLGRMGIIIILLFAAIIIAAFGMQGSKMGGE
ncbi:MAG: hypothetical protein GOV01_01210 [Candidatus Altiarchaeota archaeon]|nr:hypothetical protein [Candidatus Altiarchaeota archaeon]